MAAPHIPNLNTLRSTRGNGRIQGRGRGTPGTSSSSVPSSEEKEAAKDRIIQLTDQDASVSRLSAVTAGYLNDPWAHLFVSSKEQRRFPIINRGTYVRTTVIDDLVIRFLAHSPSQTKQIISLGAGSDTRYFRLIYLDPRPNLIYHELDFPSNSGAKIETILRTPSICSRLPGFKVSVTSTELHSSNYHIHPCDLRALPSCAISLPYIDPSIPTLLISECCLCYLPPTAADSVARYFTQTVFPPTTPLALILYEPINPHDAFGKVMVSNLAGRGIELQTLRKYGSLEVQRERLRLYGFRNAVARDVDELWECVGEEEKERVGRLEMVDEVEEWTLLARHYCVAWGWRNGEEGENEETQENGAEREDKSGAKDRSNRDDDLDKIEEVWDMWDGIWEQEKS